MAPSVSDSVQGLTDQSTSIIDVGVDSPQAGADDIAPAKQSFVSSGDEVPLEDIRYIVRWM